MTFTTELIFFTNQPVIGTYAITVYKIEDALPCLICPTTPFLSKQTSPSRTSLSRTPYL